MIYNESQTNLIYTIHFLDDYKGPIQVNANHIAYFKLVPDKYDGKYVPMMQASIGGEIFKTTCDGTIRRVLQAFNRNFLWETIKNECKEENEK